MKFDHGPSFLAIFSMAILSSALICRCFGWFKMHLMVFELFQYTDKMLPRKHLSRSPRGLFPLFTSCTTNPRMASPRCFKNDQNVPDSLGTLFSRKLFRWLWSSRAELRQSSLHIPAFQSCKNCFRRRRVCCFWSTVHTRL